MGECGVGECVGGGVEGIKLLRWTLHNYYKL